MKMRMIAAFCTAALVGVNCGYAQVAQRDSVSRHPCPGGTGTGILDTISVESLERLVQISDLILVGTVVRVLPSTLIDPTDFSLPETTSLISVNELLLGTLPYGTNTISISELGGRVEPCGLEIPDNPRFKAGEEYILFLAADKRSVPPNTSGSPRYSTIGVWSGKAKITDGKIQFLRSASQGLHRHDNTDGNTFIATVKARITSLYPKKTP